MKMKHSGKQSRFPLVIAVIVVMILSTALKAPLHAGFWDQINEKLLLTRLIGGGDFIGYERSVDTKDPLFPLEVVNDGLPGQLFGRMDLAGAGKKQVAPPGGDYL
jgi:hypothetical protein